MYRYLRKLLGRICARKLAKWREDPGAELVEAALVLPLLLMLLLGIVWVGRAYNIYETITRAAREGARYAVLPSCATCGNTTEETYTAAGTDTAPSCIGFPTYEFTNYVAPALLASQLNPKSVKNYCQQAIVINPDSDPSVRQCGVQISFKYPGPQFPIPFTTIDVSTIYISTSVTMRMENQPVDASTGLPTCP